MSGKEWSRDIPAWVVTIAGVEYEAQVAKVESFHLGLESHGMFTAQIVFAGASWEQGNNAHALDEYSDATGDRHGTAFGCDYIIECVRVLGSPELAKGRRVVVLRKGALVDGFAALNDDGSIGEPFIPQSLADRHFGAKR